MKRIYKKITLFFACMSALFCSGCSDFLTTPPLVDFTDDDFWSSELTVRAYAWGMYDQFYGYGRGGTQYGEFYWQTEGDQYYEMKFTEDLLNSNFLGFPSSAYTTNGRWEFYYNNVRKANLLLARVPEMTVLEDEPKNHWIGVGLFFRANMYFALLSSWGGVPLITKYTDPENPEDVYVSRADRKTVADQIIKDLKDATGMIRVKDEACAVNRDAAYALLARVALFEGTFRKYHGLGDYERYLTVAADAAGELITNRSAYDVQGSFKSKYNSDNLAGHKEVILYKHYEKNVMMHTLQAYTHSSSPAVHGLTKYAVESYVCQDGLPINQSPLYQGDHGIQNVRTNRDVRLQESIFDELGFHGKPYGIITSSTGYVTSVWDNPAKSITDADVSSDAKNYIDAPVFTISEVYLIYAEAKAELGTLTQNDLDISINKLRQRAGVAKLEVSGENALASGVMINDPKRTSALESATKGGVVNPIIWEIRRERRAELLGWVMLRHQDLDRWAKGEYMSSELNPDVMLGAWIGTVPDKSNVKINEQGYIRHYDPTKNTRTFTSKCYFDPIPLDEKIRYESKGYKLDQNPEW